MILSPLNAIVIGSVAVTALIVMIYWHVITKGTWRFEPAGRALMLLLLVITIITANSSFNIFLPRYVGKTELYFALYGIMQLALIGIGLTIRSEMRKGKEKLSRKGSDYTGPITVPVATVNGETPEEELSK